MRARRGWSSIEVATLVGQRVFGIALGYEDLNDHDELRHDPVMAVLAGKLAARRSDCAPLAGQVDAEPAGAEPAASRPAITRSPTTGRRSSGCSSTSSWRRTRRRPEQIILDLDATDDPLHGHQEGRFFHGYYDCYCYLPLYIFCGRHLLAAKLRRSEHRRRGRGGGGGGAHRRPDPRRAGRSVRILLRADSGFCRETLMAWCEANRVDYLFGLAAQRAAGRRDRRRAGRGRRAESQATGKPARRFKDFRWAHARQLEPRRRVIGKAEWTKGEANPRFIVTSLKPEVAEAQHLYEKVYCARGEMENRIKECQLDLFADRTSSAHHARQPAAAVVRLDGLCADLRLAPHRPRPHPVRRRHLRHHPPEAPQDRRPGARSASGASSSPWPRAARGRTSSDWPTYGSTPPPADEPETASRIPPTVAPTATDQPRPTGSKIPPRRQQTSTTGLPRQKIQRQQPASEISGLGLGARA